MWSKTASTLCMIAACTPALVLAQGNCANIAGIWSMDEKATLRCNATVAGRTETTSDPLSASRSVSIVQDSGSCSFRYDPGSIGAGTLIQYARTQVTGEIKGNSITTSGGALIPAGGVQLIESSFQASGSVSGDNMTLSGSGPARIKQTVEGGLVADISCTLASTATFARDSPGSPPASVPRVLNGATFHEGPVAPGEIVSIFGVQMGPAAGVSGQLNADGRLDASLGGVTVLFDGIPAPLSFVRSDQINAQIPYAIAGQSVTHVKVSYQGATSGEASVPVTPTAPGIFVYDNDTTRAVVLNQSGAFNSATNPAAPGEVITLFATGEGQTDPPGIDGKPADAPYPVPIAPVELQIDGQKAEIQYAGAAPGFAGLMQINARVPANIAGSGLVSLQLSIGGVSSPSVKMAVQGPSTCADCADLSITMTASPNPVASAGDLTYTIAVRNAGTLASANAVVTDNLPASVTLKSCSLACTRSGDTLTFSLGKLGAGVNFAFNIVVVAPAVAASTTITNTASVSASGDPNPANNQSSQTVTVSPGTQSAPSISSVSPISAGQGQTVSSFIVNGSNFQPASTLSFSGTGISVNSYSLRTQSQIAASITVAASAATGPRTVLVTNPDARLASSTFTVNPSTPLVSVPTLLTPVSNAVIQQNNPASGCPANPTRGFGLREFFDWTDSTSPYGIRGYELYVIHPGATIPVIDTFVATSELTSVSCNAFVIDENLLGWQWRVRAQDIGGNYSDWTPWGTFQYGPCRLANGTACYAPPG